MSEALEAMHWQPHYESWLLVAALVGAYLYALARWAPHPLSRRTAASRRQRWCFAAGVGSLWLMADWPVGALAESLFSVHMAQHLVFSLVSAPLLLLGVPGWLWRRLLRPPAVQAVWQALTRPVVALLIFNGWIAVYHWGPILDMSLANVALHHLAHTVWLATAVIMWWPVLSPLQELPHLSAPARMLYLFGQSIVPTVPASFLTFGESLLYRSYLQAPAAFGLDPLVDQQIAGLLMKIAGGFFLWGVVAVLFFRWSADHDTGAPDRLYWRDLEPGFETITASKS